MTAEELAKRFHETYEALAPQFGYETRQETRAFDPESPNGRLMIAVCNEILKSLADKVREECAKICEEHPDGLNMLGGHFVACAAAIRAMKERP